MCILLLQIEIILSICRYVIKITKRSWIWLLFRFSLSIILIPGVVCMWLKTTFQQPELHLILLPCCEWTSLLCYEPFPNLNMAMMFVLNVGLFVGPVVVITREIRVPQLWGLPASNCFLPSNINFANWLEREKESKLIIWGGKANRGQRWI